MEQEELKKTIFKMIERIEDAKLLENLYYYIRFLMIE